MWFIGVEVEQETSAHPPKKNPLRDFPEDGVFYIVFHKNPALLHLSVLLLPLVLLFPNIHTKLAENGENLISTHSQGPKIY